MSALPTFTLLPPVDKDAEGFLPVAEYVDEIGSQGKTVCFLASSVEMNYDNVPGTSLDTSLLQRRKTVIPPYTSYIIE